MYSMGCHGSDELTVGMDQAQRPSPPLMPAHQPDGGCRSCMGRQQYYQQMRPCAPGATADLAELKQLAILGMFSVALLWILVLGVLLVRASR